MPSASSQDPVLFVIMLVLFCSDPMSPREVDSAFADEAAAAERTGHEIALFSYEQLVAGDIASSLRRVRGEAPAAIYRGWMLRAEHYDQLFEGLVDREVRLMTDPASYRRAHHLPEAYGQIEHFTPRSLWTAGAPETALDQAPGLLAQFGSNPVIVKDYVKSEKHHWDSACFIPDASDTPPALAVIRRFIELRGDDFAGGLVIREYEPFVRIGTHSRSESPIMREYRRLYLNGTAIAVAPHWDGDLIDNVVPPDEPFDTIARSIASPFFTMDIAQREDGVWRIVELGDGQVAGLPDSVNTDGLYSALASTQPRR